MRTRESTGSNRKKPSLFSILAAAFGLLIVLANELPDEVVGGISAVIAIAALIGLFVKLGAFLGRIGKREVHTHDRIDHSTDLKINPKTGKTVNSAVRYGDHHSPREHWKQQLDELLANGTIDRTEYKAMLNRKFEK